MDVQNLTKKTTLSSSFQGCRTPFEKARGLMFTSAFPKKPLVFFFSKKKNWGIHMLFVPYSIDVLFLDERKRVVDLKEGLGPWRFYTPKNPCLFIIELPRGAIKKSKTNLGDRFSF